MSGFLLDTHIWVWYLVKDERLPRGLRSLIDRSPDGGWLSPVAIWELGHLVERGRIRLERDFRDWVADAQRHLPLKHAPMTWNVAIRAHEVELPHRDPADIMLAATTLEYDLTLLTVDSKLVGATGLRTRSK